MQPVGRDAVSRIRGRCRRRARSRSHARACGCRPIIWCGRRDSNPHSLLRKQILSLLRLPVSPRPRGCCMRGILDIFVFIINFLQNFLEV
jgi:hypothetical protein